MLKKAVLLACRAPSVHNSQPWRWVAEKGVVQLFVDRQRTAPATDHSGREAITSCGAVLDHLRIATTAAGWHPNTTRFPNPSDPDHLATMDFSPIEYVTEAQRNRAQAILQRRTDRLPFDRPSYWDQSRDIVTSLIGQRGEPQVLIRVGITPPMDDLPAPTPRRPLSSVLEIRTMSQHMMPQKGCRND